MKANEISERGLKILSGLALVIIACVCWQVQTTGHAQSTPAQLSPQVQEVVKLSKAKLSDDVILGYIRNSSSSYNLTADDILYLNTQGVSQPVISALVQSKGSAPSAPAAPAFNPPPSAPAMPSTPAPVVSAPPVSPYPGEAVSPYPNAAPVYSPPPAEPAPAPAPDISLSYFQSQMSAYGTWIDLPGEGPAWVPNAAAAPDWQPYFTAGHWIYTEDGFSWQSDYPWGQYAFHYGRWHHDFRYGWVWTPGYTWGPAWVAWRNAESDGYCGWAPLPPGATYEAGIGLMWDGRPAVDIDFGLAPGLFVFIPFDHFWVHDYVGFRAPYARASFLFRVSINANHYNFVGGRFVAEGIGRDRMARLTHHDVREQHLEIRDSRIAHAREVEHVRVADAHARGDIGHGETGRGGAPNNYHSSPTRESAPHSNEGTSRSSSGGNSSSRERDPGNGH